MVKLKDKLNYMYRYGWRVYDCHHINIPPQEMADRLVDVVVEIDDAFPSLIFVRDKKHFEIENANKERI